MLWAPRSRYVPIATIAFAKDGGIIVSPANVPDATWRYGHVQVDGSAPTDFAETSQRPKLHYHHSTGWVSVGLGSSPNPPEPRSVKYPPLPALTRNQILGIAATRTWDLPYFDTMRVGDVGTRETRWPTMVGFSIAIIDRPRTAQTRVALADGNRGLIAGDKQRAVLDLGELRRDAYLVARVHLDYAPRPEFPPSVTVAAYPPAPDDDRPDNVMALWSSTARNPILAYEYPDDLVTEDFLTDMRRAGPVYVRSIAERDLE